MMKRIFSIWISVLLIVLTTQSHTYAEDTLSDILARGKILVGLNAGYMPFQMRDKKGRIVGFEVDIMKLMAKRMGVKLEIVNTEWDGIIPALLTRKFDMIASGMTITQARNLKINFTDPFIEIGQTILIPKKHKDNIKNYKDLNNPTFTVVSKLGTTGEEVAKRLIRRAQYRSFENAQEGVMEVMNGKADAWVYDLPYNSIMIQTKAKGRLHHLDVPFTHEPLGWGIRKGDIDFLNWLNNFLAQIKKDGNYDRIYNKWFNSSDWQKQVQ